MKRTIIATTLALLIISSGVVGASSLSQNESSQKPTTKYYITHHQNGTSTVQLEVTMVESQQYTDWSLQWTIPKDAKIVKTSTTVSNSVQVKRDGKNVQFIENDGPPRNHETFYITYQTKSVFDKHNKYGINQYDVRLSALSGSTSYFEVTFKNQEIANAVRYSNHKLNVTQNTVIAYGTGPISLTINTIDKKPTVETDDFIVYNKEIDTDTLNNSYTISTVGTGVIPNYKQVPTIVVPEEEYDRKYGTASDGQYYKGIIYLSQDVTTGKRVLPLLTHEYTHAVTQRVRSNNPPWFSEGASQYTESIAKDIVGQEQDRIDSEQFWEYHSQNKDWVTQTKWANHGNKINRFAYDYSELLFKHKVKQTSPHTVHTLYQKIAQNNSVNAINVLYGSNWDGTVCSQMKKSQTIQCAQSSMEYSPSLKKPDKFVVIFSDSIKPQDFTIEKQDYSNNPISAEKSINELLELVIEIIKSIIYNVKKVV